MNKFKLPEFRTLKNQNNYKYSKIKQSELRTQHLS